MQKHSTKPILRLWFEAYWLKPNELLFYMVQDLDTIQIILKKNGKFAIWCEVKKDFLVENCDEARLYRIIFGFEQNRFHKLLDKEYDKILASSHNVQVATELQPAAFKIQQKALMTRMNRYATILNLIKRGKSVEVYKAETLTFKAAQKVKKSK